MVEQLKIQALQEEVNSLKQANTDLLEEKAILHDILDNLPGTFSIWDQDLHLIRWNKQHEKITGYSAATHPSLSLTDFFAQQDHTVIEKAVAETFNTGRVTLETNLLTKQGKSVPFVHTANRCLIGDHTVLMAFGIDISTQKKALLELQENEAKLRTILNTVTAGIIIIDKKTRKIVDLNPAAEEMLGQTKAALIGSCCQRTICPTARHQCPIIDLHENIDHQESTLLKDDGTEIPIIKTVSELMIHGKEHILESFVDISYQKAIEQNLHQKKLALLEKTISQDKANEALKSLLDQREVEKNTIEQSMVTHIKRFIYPYLEELEEQRGQNAKVYVDIIRSNIEQLIAPVSQKLDGAYLQMTPSEIKVADLIRQGQSSKDISTTLHISMSTVEKHRHKIRKKLDILKKNINLQTYLTSLS